MTRERSLKTKQRPIIVCVYCYGIGKTGTGHELLRLRDTFCHHCNGKGAWHA